jgi:alpha-D-ribose 1-methylphosphonate 5-triphosphate synthase subunit PhnH
MTLQLSKKHNFDMVYDSQSVYRLILEAMSNPTRIVRVKDSADKLYNGIFEKTVVWDHSAFLAVAMTLLDNEVGFNACGNDSLSDEIALLTLAKKDELESTDFAFVCDSGDIKNVIETVKCGTLTDPHKSATVIIKNDGEATHPLTLFGPGIDGNIEIQATQAVKDAITMRDAQNYEYPQGIDFIFISSGGELFAIPRLIRMGVA